MHMCTEFSDEHHFWKFILFSFVKHELNLPSEYLLNPYRNNCNFKLLNDRE